MPFGNAAAYLSKAFSVGSIGATGIMGTAMRGAATGLGRFAGMGSVAQSSIVGAGLGGMYGVFSNDTSVLGGALMGAGLGAGGAFGARGVSAYRDLRGMGRSRYRAVGGALNMLGMDARSFIGNTRTKAVNGFNAMRSSFGM